MKKVKLSGLVALHTKAKPAIEKAMLEVVWDQENEELMLGLAKMINQWGADPFVKLEIDVPMGLGDADALIRFALSLYQLYENEKGFKKENFERLLIQINRDIYLDVFEDIFGEEPRVLH